jgi:hypothetical protein
MDIEAARRVAVAVIMQAVRDASWKARPSRSGNPKADQWTQRREHMRAEARAFLTGPRIELWAALAGINAERIRARVLDEAFGSRASTRRRQVHQSQAAYARLTSGLPSGLS